jgi:hypothetical protein
MRSPRLVRQHSTDSTLWAVVLGSGVVELELGAVVVSGLDARVCPQRLHGGAHTRVHRVLVRVQRQDESRLLLERSRSNNNRRRAWGQRREATQDGRGRQRGTSPPYRRCDGDGEVGASLAQRLHGGDDVGEDDWHRSLQILFAEAQAVQNLRRGNAGAQNIW